MAINKLDRVIAVIPVHNRREKTVSCLHQLHLLDKSGIELTIVVVDDGSTDGTSEAVTALYPDVIVLHGDGSLWWSGSVNKGVEYALKHDCDHVLFLNDDIQVKPDFLIQFLKTAKSHQDAIVCGVILDINNKNSIISAGRYAKGFLGYDYSGFLCGADVSLLPEKEYESDVESGYAMLVPVDVFRDVGFFDSKRFPHHMGDMDFVLRATRKGLKVVINPRAVIYTKIGENYFHNQIVNKPFLSTLRIFFDIKSTVNLRTRWFFYWRHTPYYLGWLSFLYFLFRMCAALILKILLPADNLEKVMRRRTIDLKDIKY